MIVDPLTKGLPLELYADNVIIVIENDIMFEPIMDFSS